MAVGGLFFSRYHTTYLDKKSYIYPRTQVWGSVGLFESFGTLLGFVQNRKSMQTLSFVLFKFWFQNKD